MTSLYRFLIFTGLLGVGFSIYGITDRANLTGARPLQAAPGVRCRLNIAPANLVIFTNPSVCATIDLQTYTVPPTSPPPDWVSTSSISEGTNQFPQQSFSGSPGGTMRVCPRREGTLTFSGVVTGISGVVVACDNTVTLNSRWAPPPACTLTVSGPQYACGALAVAPVETITLDRRGGPINSAELNRWPITLSATGGTFRVPPGPNPTLYIATLRGPGGTRTCSATAGGGCIRQVAYTEPACCPEGSTTIHAPHNNPPSCTWYARNTWTGQYMERGCAPGCFSPETEMWMGDGSKKAAMLVVPGDSLWSPSLKQTRQVRKVIVGPEKFPLIELGYDHHVIRVSSKHPMMSFKRGLIRADELEPREAILGADGRFHRLKILRRLPVNRNQIVYNFELATDSDEIAEHLVVGNGIVTGDYFAQYQLETGKLP